MATAEELYGRKPKYQSPGAAALQSVAANLETLPKAEELGTRVNAFNQAELLAMLRKAIPGFDKKVGMQSDLLESGMRGEVPADVQKQLQLRAASKSVAGGYGGSGMARNLEARDFGLTSFDITQKALDSTSRWTESMARLTQPALFNVGSAFISPQQQFDFNKLVEEVRVAPSPSKRGAHDFNVGMAGMVLSGYAGGQGYNNAYQPASQGSQAPTQYFTQNSGANSIPGGSYYNGSQAWSGTHGETAGEGAFNF